MSWQGVIERLLGRVPSCPSCGEATQAAGEELLHMMPPVLETRYRCPRCGETIVRREAPDVWG